MAKFTCKKCNKERHIADFYYIKAGKPTRYTCKKCWNAYNGKYWNKRDLWNYQILRKYGLSKEQYLTMFEKQNKSCAICFATSLKRLSVDHCHKTGKIRGLLCAACNTGIGQFKDKQALLQNAINYLDNVNKIS